VDGFFSVEQVLLYLEVGWILLSRTGEKHQLFGDKPFIRLLIPDLK
jgi:hypothetical protein